MDQNNAFGSSSKLPRSPRLVNGARGGSKNKQWVNGTRSPNTPPTSNEGGRSEKGAASSVFISAINGLMTPALSGNVSNGEDNTDYESGGEQVNGHAKSWDELVKAREVERSRAIREGKMDDPSKPKRLDEAITIVGTCQDMCPEFERYRRERENNLDKLECIIGPDGKPTRKVDHKRAVKMYERGQGDKIIPSDLRPAPVLKRTLDYLFHELIPRVGFVESQAFVRDRSRAVRNDCTIQRETGPIAIECHERCTRYHILSLHRLYDVASFDRSMEIQQLMNSLLSLREFYDDQRGRYESPHELEMRVYHRLGLIRDKHDRNEGTPPHILNDPIFLLITRFRAEVQAASQPITKTSKMIAGPEAMQTFMELATILRQRGNIVMIYLVACFLKYIFGPDAIEDIESIRGDLSDQDIIDGISTVSSSGVQDDVFLSGGEDTEPDEVMAIDAEEDVTTEPATSKFSPPSPLKSQATQWLNSNFGSAPTPPKAGTPFFTPVDVHSPFSAPSFSAQPGSQSLFTDRSSNQTNGSTSVSVFGFPASASKTFSVFGNETGNVFGGPVFGSTSTKPFPSVFQVASTGPPVKKGEQSINHAVSTLLHHVVDFQPPNLPSLPEAARSSGTFLNPSAPVFLPRMEKEISPNGSTDLQLQSIQPTKTPTLRRESLSSPLSAFPGKFKTPFSATPSSSPKTSPLSINTAPIVDAKQTRKSVAIDSPLEPPRMSRPVPISLPDTPTVGRFSGFPSTPLYDQSKPISPLLIMSPALPRSPFQHPTDTSQHLGESTLLANQNSHGITSKPSNSKIINGATPPIKTNKELKEEADQFARRSLLVYDCFMHWKSRAIDIAAWKDACRRSEVYKLKSSQNGSIQPSPATKRRRISSDMPAQVMTPQRRTKRKKADPAQSYRDEELAQRFKENHEEHERRWAEGSFLNVIRSRLEKLNERIPPHWRVWLSTNPDNDSTAIWLDQKFAVPSSGKWESETVFSIPISARPSQQSHPGLIIFECVPLEGIDDDLERKYRVLDDCARLRDIIASFPEDRHFLPSILAVIWADIGGKDSPTDFSEMLEKLKMEEAIGSYSVFTVKISEADLDQQLSNTLKDLNLDLQGKLVDRVTLSDISEQFIGLWRGVAITWVLACGSEDRFNWRLFGAVLQISFQALNLLIVEISNLWEPDRLPPPLLEPPDLQNIMDAISAHSVVRDWLQSRRSSENTMIDKWSVNDETLIEHLSSAAMSHLGEYTTLPFEKRAVPKVRIAGLTSRFRLALEDFSSELRKAAKTIPRIYSKRQQSGNDSTSDFGSRASSSAPSTPEFPSKRARRSDGSNSYSFDPDMTYSPAVSPTPSATPSAADSTSSVVTISMLRALAREVLNDVDGEGAI